VTPADVRLGVPRRLASAILSTVPIIGRRHLYIDVIDIHLHPLPFLDDGAADWDESLEMAVDAVQDGVEAWIATPHWTGKQGERDKVTAIAAELVERLERQLVRLRVHVGQEVILTADLVEALAEGRAFTLAGTRYVLLETAQFERGAYVESALFKLQSNGYRVILAHPERLPSWQTDQRELRELVYRGCYLQVNAGSLAGSFGSAAQRTAERLLQLGWVSFLASDGHSPDHRPPLLSKARDRAAQIIGEEAVEKLVHDNPRRLLAGEYLPPVTPEVESRRFSWLPWLRRG
jgi:protein-tyrosine phosphatase